MSEESPIQMLERQVTRIKEEETKDDTELHLYQMRRTWETRLGVFKHLVPSDNGCVFYAANFSICFPQTALDPCRLLMYI